MSSKKNKKLDSELILQKLAELENYVNLLKEIVKIKKEQYVLDYKAKYASERLLQISIECILDIGNHIISRLALGKPQTYKEIIEILVKHEILPVKIKEKMVKIVAFRNRLVHRYSNLEPTMIYEKIHQAIQDFSEFAKQIEKMVEND